MAIPAFTGAQLCCRSHYWRRSVGQGSTQCVPELRCRLIAVILLVFQCLAQHILQRLRHVIEPDDLRALARHHLVQRRGQGPQVAARICQRHILSLFRWHEVQRAQHGTGHRLAGIRRFVLRQTEVRQLGNAGLCQQHVRRFNVAMDDVGLVCRAQPVTQLARHFDRFIDRNGTLTALIQQTVAFHILHDQERTVCRATVIVDLHDVGMIQSGDRLSLRQKPTHRRLASGRVSQHPLDGHLAVQPGVGGQQDLPHPAFAERFLDLVPRQVHDLHVQISVAGETANVRQRGIRTAAECRLITQTAIRRIGRLTTAFVRLLITKALVVFGHCHRFAAKLSSLIVIVAHCGEDVR